MNPDLTTRPFTEADYDFALALWQRSEGVEVAEGDTRAEIALYLGRNPNLSWVAECESKVVGAVLCGHDGRRGLIYHLAVEAKFRGRGVGRRLVQECLVGLRSVGIKRVLLLVADANQAGRRFWRAQGFDQIDGALSLSRDLT